MTFLAQALAVFIILVSPGCQRAEEPKQLLTIASSYAGPAGKAGEDSYESTSRTRYKALRTLLALQGNRFNVNLPPIPINDTTGIDHFLVMALPSSDGNVTLLATPTWQANRKAQECDYWSLEQLTFASDGKLLSRQPYKE
jgi:hypothetical protein